MHKVSKSRKILIILLSLFCLTGLYYNTPAFADDTAYNVCDDGLLDDDVLQANGCYGSSNDAPVIIVNILYSIIGISGLVATIFIVVGGIKYMASTGEPDKVKTAKSTILYALIGLAITALAFAIVNFAVFILGGSSGGDSGNGSSDSSNVASLRVRNNITMGTTPSSNTYQLAPHYNGEGALTYSSSDPSVASVDTSGKITAHQSGTTTITVTAPDGSTATVTVSVDPPVSAGNVFISPSNLTLEKGKKKTLTVTVTPAKATDKTVKWTSSNKKIASVNSKGQVKAKKKGTVTITATTSNGKTATAKVTVVNKGSSSSSSSTNKTIEVSNDLINELDEYHQGRYSGYSTSCGSNIGGTSCGISAWLAAHYALTGKGIDYMSFMEEGCNRDHKHWSGRVADYSAFLNKPQRTFYEQKYGVKTRYLTKSTDTLNAAYDKVVAQLKKGNVVINRVVHPPSIFTGGDHFVVSLSYRNNNGGEIYVWNPNSSRPSGWYGKDEYITNALSTASGGIVGAYSMSKT